MAGNFLLNRSTIPAYTSFPKAAKGSNLDWPAREESFDDEYVVVLFTPPDHNTPL